MSRIKSFLANESGATAIEYSLLAALIGVVILTAATQLGTKISSKFDSVRTALN